MSSTLKYLRFGAAVLAITVAFPGVSPMSALAQTTPPASTAVVLSEATIKALQDALNKQGVAVKADGILSAETRAAIRRYQSLHHLPVTGEPDKATLDKLGVVAQQGAAPTQPSTTAQATPPADSTTGQVQAPAQPAQMPGGMMSGPMMQGMMQGMMKTMQGMMGMMQMQPGQMQPGQMQPGAARSPQAQGGMMMMNCPMMPGANQSQGSAPAMMQMMQGMMQMMQMMQGQMQPEQKP
jgi:hypothetical protein